MDIYNIWCDLKEGVSDLAFVENLDRYLSTLRTDGHLDRYRITRRKLGLGPADLGEFHLILEFRDLTQLDQAFKGVAERSDPIEGLHHVVNSQVSSIRFALYRDFPDEHRALGQERF